MKNRKKSTLVLIGAAITASVLLTAGSCDTGKGLQPYQDAKVSSVNEAPALQGTMPDGFSNFAAKCDGPNMVYVIYHADSAYGSIDVVPNDPRCA